MNQIDVLMLKQLDLFVMSTAKPSWSASQCILKKEVRSVRYTKKSISKSLRMIVWSTYIGLSKGEAPCYCCNTNVINTFRFQCGHVVAERNGGTTTVDNLRPICELCNQSMGTKNLDEFRRSLEHI